MSSLQVDLVSGAKRGLAFKNPILIASGFAGYGSELGAFGDLGELGGMITGPISLPPWRGAVQPRLLTAGTGVLLRTGNQNPGLQRVLKRYRQVWASTDTTWIARLCGAEPADYGALALRLEQVEGMAAIEVSFPWSVDNGWHIVEGLEIIEALQAETWLPLLAVVPPLGGDLAWRCQQAGADVLVIADVPLGAVWRDGQWWVGQAYDPAAHAVAVQRLRQVVQQVDVPVMGRGAIHSLADILDMLAAGAVAVQIDSEIWRDPSAPWRLLHELAQWMADRGLSSLEAFEGHPDFFMDRGQESV